MNVMWKTNSYAMNDQDDPVLQLLRLRGVADPHEFLRITKKKLHNPYKMKGLKRAVTRILEAIRKKESIWIYGDYDADGVSSTSLWVLAFREFGVKVNYFVPDRFRDGYGLNNRAILEIKNAGCDLMITCDTGITAIEQVVFAKKHGIDVIITDHHEPQPTTSYEPSTCEQGKIVQTVDGDEYLIPDTIVVNPRRPDCSYPFKGLAGVGVSFKILCAVAEKIHPAGRSAIYQFMDLVALGTMADVMDLIDENRVIGRLGLDMMNNTKNRGMYQLIRANEMHDREVTSKDVGWTLAPCINAAGRIVSAMEAVKMLIADNKLDAYRAAKTLVDINAERKELTKQYVDEIIEAIDQEQELKGGTNIIVHYHPAVPEGIIGLIAGRLMNHYYKPVILLSDAEEEGLYKGSGRSIDAFDLFSSLSLHRRYMENFGGHKAACGLTVREEVFPTFKSTLEFYADAVLTEKDLQPKLFIDCTVSGDLLDLDFVYDIMRLEPFGSANRPPIFMMKNVQVIQQKGVGDAQNHFWALVTHKKKTFSTIGFFLQEKYEDLGKPKKLDLAFTPAINEWPKGSGKYSVQLVIEDFRKATK